MAGEKRKFRETYQIEVFNCTFFPPREKITEALICSNPGGCAWGEEKRSVLQMMASLNVSACCSTSPETLGAPSAVVQGDALMSITFNVIALYSQPDAFHGKNFRNQFYRENVQKKKNKDPQWTSFEGNQWQKHSFQRASPSDISYTNSMRYLTGPY